MKGFVLNCKINTEEFKKKRKKKKEKRKKKKEKRKKKKVDYENAEIILSRPITAKKIVLVCSSIFSARRQMNATMTMMI